MSNIFPTTPQPFRAASVQGPDRQLLVNPMKGTGLDEVLKHQLGMTREKNRHDLAMQRSMMDMITKFRPGGTRGNKVMGWHNPRQKRILEQADNAMYSAIDEVMKTDSPTTQDILKLQRGLGEATTRATEQVAYEQSVHMKYLDQYAKSKDTVHAGAYNAALDKYYNWDGEEPFDLRQLDPNLYRVQNPFDVADDYMKRRKSMANESIEEDPETGIRYTEARAENLQEGLRGELLKRSAQTIGWDYDAMSEEERAAVSSLYPDKESYINGMIDEVINTVSPDDVYVGISETRSAPKIGTAAEESKYTKSHAAKISTMQEWAGKAGYEITEAEALGLWEEVMRMGKNDRYKGKLLQDLVKIALEKLAPKEGASSGGEEKKRLSDANPTDAEGRKSLSPSAVETLERDNEVGRVVEDAPNEYTKSFGRGLFESIPMRDLEIGGQQISYDYSINPLTFLNTPYIPSIMDGGPGLTQDEKDEIGIFLNSLPFEDKPIRLTDQDKTKFAYYMKNPHLAEMVVKKTYASYLGQIKQEGLKGDQKKLLSLFNYYNGDIDKVKSHIESGKDDPTWVKEMQNTQYDRNYLLGFYKNTVKDKLGVIESGGAYDAVYSGDEWSSAIGKYQVLAYSRWKEIDAVVPDVSSYQPKESTINKLMQNPWVKSRLSGRGNIKMGGKPVPKQTALKTMGYFLEHPEIQDTHYKEYLEKPAFAFADKMKSKYPDSGYNSDQLFYIFHHHGSGCAEKFVSTGKTCKELLELNSNAHRELVKALKKLA